MTGVCYLDCDSVVVTAVCVFVLQAPGTGSDSSKLKLLCAEDEAARLCWLTGMRLVKVSAGGRGEEWRQGGGHEGMSVEWRQEGVRMRGIRWRRIKSLYIVFSIACALVYFQLWYGTYRHTNTCPCTLSCGLNASHEAWGSTTFTKQCQSEHATKQALLFISHSWLLSRRSLNEVFVAVRVSAEREPEDVDPVRQLSTEWGEGPTTRHTKGGCSPHSLCP